jgi:membrane protein implicated in regulation of membrane protease activity
MRPSRLMLPFWIALIALLLIVEIAEATHLFTIPIQSAISDPLAFVFALVFTTILALVGAIFIGIYVSHRILSPGGFTPFEEEMLRMREEVHELKEAVERLRPATAPTDPPEGKAP